MKFWQRAGALTCIATAAFFTTMCGKDSSTKGDISTMHTASYVGSGSVWNWSLNVAGTFTATKKTLASDTTPILTLTGTYTTLSTGYYKFTVPTGGATGAGAGSVTLPATAYGFGVPNVVMMVKPIGAANSELLVMPVLSSTCPTADTNFSWVEANTSDYNVSDDLTTKDIWGSAVVPAIGGAIVGKKFNLGGTVSALSGATAGTCTSGKFTLGTGFISMTDGGVGLVKPNDADATGDIIALPRDTSVVETTLNGKNFVALVFDETDGVKPINISFPATGAGTYTMLTDVETGAAGETGPLAVLEAGTGDKAGFLKMRANASTASKQPTMWAAVVSNIGGSNRTLFFASGMNVPTAGGSATESFSVIAIQK